MTVVASRTLQRAIQFHFNFGEVSKQALLFVVGPSHVLYFGLILVTIEEASLIVFGAIIIALLIFFIKTSSEVFDGI
jgi:hypothetical protein